MNSAKATPSERRAYWNGAITALCAVVVSQLIGALLWWVLHR